MNQLNKPMLEVEQESMSEQEVPLTPPAGGDDQSQSLSLSQVTEGYDETTMGDILSEEQYDKQPNWKKGRISEMAYKRKQAEQERDIEKGQRIQLEGRLSGLEAQMQALGNESRNGTEPGKDDPSQFKPAQWRDFIAEAEKAQRDFALSPEDEALRAKFLEFDPRHVEYAREQLSLGTARGVVDEYRKTNDAEAAQQRMLQTHQQQMFNKYGPDALNPKSELMQNAATEYLQMTQERGVTEDPQFFLREWAVDSAYRKLRGDRDGRGPSEVDRRRLAVEAETRREAAPLNEIAALRSQGDWKSIDAAQNIEIKAAMKSWFPDLIH